VPLVEDDESLPIEMPKTAYTPLSGLAPTAVDYSTQWRTAYTYLRVILFMTSFLYAFSDPRDPAVFMRRHVLLDESRHAEHASDIYDFSGLKRILVLKEINMREALATIGRFCPSLLDKRGEKIVVTSQKIYDGLAYYVRTVHDQTLAMSDVELRKRRWDLARVIAPIREGGGSAALLLTPVADRDRQIPTLNFGSARAVRTWFRGLRTGESSGSMIPVTDSRPVMEIVKGGTGVILFRHPRTDRVWLIPGVTDSLRDTAVMCYLWNTQRRVAILDTQGTVTASIDRLAVSGGRPAGRSKITAIFRPKTPSGRRTHTRTGHLKTGGVEDEEENLSALRHLVDSEDVVVIKYVITRDNRVELLAGQQFPTGEKQPMIIEVLRTGPNRYTPMLSP
jgi:hypothetical protein